MLGEGMRRNKEGIDRKRYKRGQLHVKQEEVCVCVHMCAFHSYHLSLPAQKAEGTWQSVMCMLHMGPVKDSVLSVAICVMITSVSCLCGTGILTQLCYWLNQQRVKHQPHPSTQRYWDGHGWPGRRESWDWRCWRRQPHS